MSATVLISFTILAVVFRMVLSLHYPNDMLAGIVIGMIVAAISPSF
ncbi:MAG: phosphatase PAP2 family protein [Betaproteobacteria bacterium]|nr:phosphatase PAP2 family protein [Betaproteobacteria bacterium]